MKTQFELKVKTEKSMTTVAKLLLLLNRKQLIMSKMGVSESANLFEYNLNVSGEEKNVQHSAKLIAKQVGVYDVSLHSVSSKLKEQAIIM